MFRSLGIELFVFLWNPQISLADIYQLAKFGDFMSCSSKNIFKMYLVSCANTHRDVTDFLNHGMVKNTETWISLERNIIFLRNQKILNLCLTWHSLRSYGFVAEVTFKGIVTAELLLKLKICSSDEMLPRFKICSSDETPLKLKICSIGSSDEARRKHLIKTWWKTFF